MTTALPTSAPTSPLQRERQKQGLSLRALGHFAETSHTTIRELERGSLDVAPATKKLSQYLSGRG